MLPRRVWLPVEPPAPGPCRGPPELELTGLPPEPVVPGGTMGGVSAPPTALFGFIPPIGCWGEPAAPVAVLDGLLVGPPDPALGAPLLVAPPPLVPEPLAPPLDPPPEPPPPPPDWAIATGTAANNTAAA